MYLCAAHVGRGCFPEHQTPTKSEEAVAEESKKIGGLASPSAPYEHLLLLAPAPGMHAPPTCVRWAGVCFWCVVLLRPVCFLLLSAARRPAAPAPAAARRRAPVVSLLRALRSARAGGAHDARPALLLLINSSQLPVPSSCGEHR